MVDSTLEQSDGYAVICDLKAAILFFFTLHLFDKSNFLIDDLSIDRNV